MLVDTSHPGNIGATARAMKTMGLGELALVRPKHFPSDEATARAAGADDVLGRRACTTSCTSAIADCGWVVGASARLRTVALPIVDPREAAATIWQRLPENRVAVLMGPEQSGLTNDDLARCQQLVHIPANPEFSSLESRDGRASALLRAAHGGAEPPACRRAPSATAGSRRPPSSKACTSTSSAC